MIRVVLAAAMAVALVGTALPAVDDARRDRTAARLATTADRLARAASTVATGEDPTGPDLPGARRPVDVRVPARSWTDAGVAWVAVGGTPPDVAGPDGDAALVAYRIAEGRVRRHPLPGVDVVTPAGAVVVREAGRHRVRLGLRRTSGGAAVVVTPG